MGHWSERLLADLKDQLGIASDDQDAEILQTLRTVGTHLELLTGHEFGTSRSVALRFQAAGLPFVDIPDLQTATFAGVEEAWPIPDLIHPEIATVLQVGRFQHVYETAAPTAAALGVAGDLVARCISSREMLDAVWRHLVEQRKTETMEEIVGGLLDPDRAVHVPIAGVGFDGWWIQVSRRLLVVTKDTPEVPRLIETLIEPDGRPGALAVTEPRLILARLTDHPVQKALSFRIWIVADSPRSNAWRLSGIAGVVHGYGIPIVSLDAHTTPHEAAAQLLLAAYWHGYLQGEEPAIPEALAAAFPRDVQRVWQGTDAPSRAAAAALLFERLLRPGFDPRRSAQSVRHYVRRHATTLVRAHHAEVTPGRWIDLGVSERYYYRLLARFAMKDLGGKYEVDDGVLARISKHLEGREERATRLELLRQRGFTDAAARKWLQRHPVSSLRTAQPRPSRPRPDKR